jgi:hypothetical protein
MIHVKGLVETELNAPKGIWCEVCSKDCTKEHLITFQSCLKGGKYMYQHVCVKCAQDLITCLRLSLMDAVLTEKTEKELI